MWTLLVLLSVIELFDGDVYLRLTLLICCVLRILLIIMFFYGVVKEKSTLIRIFGYAGVVYLFCGVFILCCCVWWTESHGAMVPVLVALVLELHLTIYFLIVTFSFSVQLESNTVIN